MTRLGYHVLVEYSISQQDSPPYILIMSSTSMMYPYSRHLTISPQYEPFHVSNGYLPWKTGPSVAT